MQVNHGNHSIRMCNSCLLTFNTERAFQQHQRECNKTATELPKEDANILKFEHYDRSMEVPFAVYADFECMLENIESCQPDPSKSSTTAIKVHVPVAVSYYLKCSFNSSLDKLFQYTGNDCARVFLGSLIEVTKRMYQEHLRVIVPQIVTFESSEMFRRATNCHICGNYLGLDRVRDHCHLTGIFRGAAHSRCNLNFKVPKFFPIFFHNLTGYDAH
ncbi:uncharacterized protein LOC129907704 [Episyrphus balteatus]|uniref:uncharacterized protein LOC129907704 n=1 Tax=Episyrphus balteatus TaxID=286459 RepID=UPI002485D168|nr:uncharacterized protein LOC129907704 [Episyrphus balteatus]